MASSTISFFVPPKHPLTIIASGAPWLSRFGPMFQAPLPRHEAKLRSAIAFPHFHKLTVPLHDCQGKGSYVQTPPRRSQCAPAHDFGNRHVVIRCRRDTVSKDAYRSRLEHTPPSAPPMAEARTYGAGQTERGASSGAHRRHCGGGSWCVLGDELRVSCSAQADRDVFFP